MSEAVVRVAVRIRPLIKSEIDKACQTCLTVVPGGQQIIVRNMEKAFTFDYVFPGDVNQEDFYEIAIKGMVENIFKGYNATILAYGQTGSGKTYSMGTNYIATEEMGVLPRAVHNIFQIIESKEDWSFNVSVSFMELYQEQLYDLLADKPRNQSIVDIRDDGKNVKVSGVVENVVTNAQEALQCLTRGSLGRVTGATAMNAQSSRSHAIFTICIHQQKQGDPRTATTAKFHLVDLACSERSRKTQATGERFKEGVNINKGLLALGNVISQLGGGGPNAYIGYRDSKLTRLLQDSLGGNSMTLMIACVSPAYYNLDETLSTLRYADRAHKIKNKPVINQGPQVLEINRLNKVKEELRLALVDREIRISCLLEHQELSKKNQSLLESREQIQADVMKILEEFREILNEFDKNPESYAEHRAKVEALYLKLLAVAARKPVNEVTCEKEVVHNDLLDKYEMLHGQMEEYKTTERERRLSQHLALNLSKHQIEDVDEEKNDELNQELERHKEMCNCLEQYAKDELVEELKVLLNEARDNYISATVNENMTENIIKEQKEKLLENEQEIIYLKDELTYVWNCLEIKTGELDLLEGKLKKESLDTVTELNKNLEMCQDEKEHLQKLPDENNDKLLEFEDRLESAKDVEQEKDEIKSLQQEMENTIRELREQLSRKEEYVEDLEACLETCIKTSEENGYIIDLLRQNAEALELLRRSAPSTQTYLLDKLKNDKDTLQVGTSTQRRKSPRNITKQKGYYNVNKPSGTK